MKLRILLPTRVLVDCQVRKVTAEAKNGSFTLLPRHIDFAAALVPGLLFYETAGDDEEFLGIDEGLLVKCGPEVTVATRNAVRGPDLGRLREAVEREFLVLDERERLARSALAHLEADLVRRFIEMGERRHE